MPKRRRKPLQAPRHFDPSAVTASARKDISTFNDDDLPMVETYRHYSSSLTHLIGRETTKSTRKHDNNCSTHKDAYTATNPYLQEFLGSDLCRALQSDPALASWANKRSLKKEIIEGMATLHRIQEQLETETTVDDKLVFFDLCSGKGLLSIFLSKTYPTATIHMIDHNPKMVLTHLESTPNVHFHLMDLFSEDMWHLLLEPLTAATNRSSTRIVLVGMHLCGALAYRSIQLYQRLVQSQLCSFMCHLIVCPCCLPRRSKQTQVYGHTVKDRAARLGIPAYQLWCTQLYWELRRENFSGKICQSCAPDGAAASPIHTTMLPDLHMSLETSTFITASNAAVVAGNNAW